MSNKPELVWEPGAIDDLVRLREFLQPKNPKAAMNAARRIIEAANLLLEQPYLGHPIDEMPDFHKLFIPFGKNGYEIKYRLDDKKVVILRVWHAREDRNT